MCPGVPASRVVFLPVGTGPGAVLVHGGLQSNFCPSPPLPFFPLQTLRVPSFHWLRHGVGILVTLFLLQGLFEGFSRTA